jgi:hypothetical protein
MSYVSKMHAIYDLGKLTLYPPPSLAIFIRESVGSKFEIFRESFRICTF